MPHVPAILALSAGLVFGAPVRAGQGLGTAPPRRGADLVAHPLAPSPRNPGTAGARAEPPATAACLADVCQPIVAVPGFDPQFTRPSRTELFADLLERSHIEPLASIVSAFAATGLRVDYTPGFVAGASASGRARWGSVSVLLRWRLDPLNEPVFGRRSARR